MRKRQAILKKLFFLPFWLIFILTLASGAALVYVFMKGMEETWPAYGLYAAATYTLSVLCIWCVRTLPAFGRRMKQKARENPWGNRYMTDVWYRMRVSLRISVGVNLFYSVFKLVMGIRYQSSWFGALAFYYMVLTLMRFLLLRSASGETTDIMEEYRKVRICAWLLFVLNLALSGIVVHMVWKNESFIYPGLLIFVAAAYTFYNIIASMWNAFRYQRYNSPILSVSKVISFITALVSILSLQTAMITQFSGDEYFRRLMNALTGTGVCLIIMGLAVYMILYTNRKLKGAR